MSADLRVEHDSMGPVSVPADALWGAQTQRAVEVYAISGRRMPGALLSALGRIKRACAAANAELGELDPELAAVIERAAGEVVDGRLHAHFPIDLFQTGSGTASNMNANEVISNRAIQLLGGVLGSRDPVHPNDHVNLGQSSNDVVPTAIHVAAAVEIDQQLLPALDELHRTLAERAAGWDHVLKSGRTHLMDATPIRLSQEVGGWAAQVAHGRRRAQAARDALLELALGGTAVGTGINRHPDLPRRAIARLADETGLPFREAADHFEAQGARDGVVEAHGQLETIATGLFKIASDLRLLASGPRTGFAELSLPALAPGSSIMPGKVNPVMCEVLTQVCVRALGNGATVKAAGMSGQLQLNVFLPVMADALLDSIALLANGSRAFARQAIAGMQADEARCRETLDRNLSLCTALAPELGYDRAAALAKQAWKDGTGIRAAARAALSTDELSDERLDALLDPRSMTEPG
ncbi:MAG: class II fumarate hydratase [Alphaproteobacteria bacterium]|nr:class II fumarate hydratase [Alphaproteobacteria bacterium]